MSEEKIEKISRKLVNLEDKTVGNLVEEALNEDIDSLDILQKGLGKGLSRVGDKFEKGEYFLSELTMAGEIAEKNLEKILPKLKRGKEDEEMPKLLIGTVEGDIHNIGKNIVKGMLAGSGFEVIDLGVDVTPQEFADAVEEHDPEILGLSALLTTTLEGIRETIEKLEQEELRQDTIIMIGGAPTTQEFAEDVGANYYGEDVMDSVKKAKHAISTHV